MTSNINTNMLLNPFLDMTPRKLVKCVSYHSPQKNICMVIYNECVMYKFFPHQ